MPTKIVLGLQYGDEGKGKVVDQLVENWADVVVRFQGGDNAGHTIYDEAGEKYVLHSLPTGVLKSNVQNVIARGCVVNPINIMREIKQLCLTPRDLMISSGCPSIMPYHIEEDKAKYQSKIGTTAKGIGPAYSDYYSRSGLMLKDVCCDFDRHKDYIIKRFVESSTETHSDDDIITMILELRAACKALIPYLSETVEIFLQDMYSQDKNIVLEGAQGWGLDIWSDFYPNVTSSSPSVGGAIISTGLNHIQIDEVIGIAKIYKTRVGAGPFPTEVFDIDETRIKLGEYGATTARPRRIGWLDLDELKEACQKNGVDHLLLTRTDSAEYFPTLYYKFNSETKKISSWNLNDEESKDVHMKNLNKFIDTVSKSVEVPFVSYSYGPRRNQIKWFKENYL
jgi:adenylosuccinate synthase